MANASEEVGYDSPAFAPKSGPHSVRVVWAITYSVNLTTAIRNASQPPSALVEIWVLADLIDSSSLTYFPTFIGLNQAYSCWGCPTPLVLRVSGSYSTFVNATLNASRTYFVETYVEIYVGAAASVGSASASVDMGAGGNYAKLRSISLK